MNKWSFFYSFLSQNNNQAMNDASEVEKSLQFEIEVYQLRKFREWYEKHRSDCKCREGIIATASWEGPRGSLTYCFTPSPVGEEVVVRCICGSEIDISPL